MVIKNIIKLGFQIYLKLKLILNLLEYNDFTIENYFRKQGARVGKNNRIMIRTLGEDPFLITIGNHCTITSGVSLITHDGAGWIFTDEIADLQKFGRITILDNCFIGLRSAILPNVTIGPNSIVGACAVVTKDVPPDTVVAGNPAKVICSIDDYKEKVLQIWKDQKPSQYLNDFVKGKKYSPEQIEEAKRRDQILLHTHLKKLYKL